MAETTMVTKGTVPKIIHIQALHGHDNSLLVVRKIDGVKYCMVVDISSNVTFVHQNIIKQAQPARCQSQPVDNLICSKVPTPDRVPVIYPLWGYFCGSRVNCRSIAGLTSEKQAGRGSGAGLPLTVLPVKRNFQQIKLNINASQNGEGVM
ncbi:hypothetical protein CBL_13971 [Carabus blaptoides fortunei]